ncbi:MAG: site-specific integrase, partial [Acidobacteriota bacterium]
PDGRTFYLTVDEAGRLLDTCPPHLRRLVTVLFETGGRLGEVLALRWENVDFENRRIRFDSRTTKASRERFIPMTEEAEAVLREAHAQRLTSPAAREWVFTYAGRRLRSARRAFYAAMERAGIPRPKGTGFHLTRHTAATWYMSTEGQKGKLQKILGHSSAKTTDRYDHTGAEYIETARQHLGRSAIIRRMASGHLSGHLEEKPHAQ